MVAVVVRVRDELERAIGDRVIHPGARADRLLCHFVLRRACRHDADDGEALLDEREVRDVRLDCECLVILLLDVGDGGKHRGIDVAAPVGRLAGRALEGLDDVLRRHGVAVGELCSVAQGDLERRVVDLLGVVGSKLVERAVVMEIDAVEAFDDLPVRAAGKSGGRARRIVVLRAVGGAGRDRAATLGASLGAG